MKGEEREIRLLSAKVSLLYEIIAHNAKDWNLPTHKELDDDAKKLANQVKRGGVQ